MIQMIKNVVCSSIIFLFYYSWLRSFHSAEKTWYKNEMSLLWHNIFCITKTTSDAKLAFHYYPFANEVAKGYSNATFHLSFLLSVRPSFRNIFVNTLESTFFNGFWPNLVHTKRIWNPIDFQGQRSRSLGQIFRRGDMPRFALPLFILFLNQIFAIWIEEVILYFIILFDFFHYYIKCRNNQEAIYRVL